jgi:uncharacterized protein (DUF608 family)
MRKSILISALILLGFSNNLTAQVAKELKVKDNGPKENIDNSEVLLEKYYELTNEPGLMTRGEHTVFSDERLTGIQFPVGGIGTGCIQFDGYAQPRYWQIFNNMTHEHIPNSFFAVRVKSGASTQVRALQTKDAGVFKGMQSLEAVAKFPFMEYHFKDENMPASIIMEVFNPFVPTNLKQSGIPVVFYKFYIENPTNESMEISLLASQQNAVGYSKVPIDHTENGFAYNFKAAIEKEYAKGNNSQFYGGNSNTIKDESNTKVLYMSSEIPKNDQHFGQMALVLFDASNIENAQGIASWNNEQKLLNNFSKTGEIKGKTKIGESKKGTTYSGALNSKFTLKPGEKKEITMALAWYFPNGKNGGFMDKWDGWGKGDWEGNGNKYATYWSDINDLTNYLNTNYKELTKNSKQFSTSLFETNLPVWLVERLASQLSIIKSRTFFHDKDDYVGMWEGTGGCDGSCAGNCNHVWHYAQGHARVFPELGKKIRTQTYETMHPNGQISYRQPAGSFAFDGQCGDILGAYREHLLSEDDSWLLKYYPDIKKAMNYVIEEHDKDKDGWLSDRTKHTTYDASMTGNPSYLSSLYLAALVASEKMALIANDKAQADEWKSIAEKSAKKQDNELWNGEYFQQIRGEKPATDYEDGCHSDQLLGQWWADQLGLGSLYPDYKIKSANEAILKYNFKSTLEDYYQGHRTFALPEEAGMVVTTWPRNPRTKYASRYSGEVWTTFEYTIGSQLIKYGKLQDALTVLRSGYKRYDGKYRTGYTGRWGNFGFSGNPFGDDECGQFYGRALSQWSVMLAVQGFDYNGPEGIIGFNPKWKPENHQSFFTVSKGWGVFNQKRAQNVQENSIRLDYGTLSLNTINLNKGFDVGKNINVALNGKKLNVTPKKEGDTVTITFDAVTMQAGDVIKILMN